MGRPFVEFIGAVSCAAEVKLVVVRVVIMVHKKRS
jgi:hypothetical protein